MKSIATKVFFLLLIVALYFLSDLFEKGMFLNQAFPVPVLGCLFWGLIAIVVIDLVIKPAIEFVKLTRARSGDTDKDIRKDAERIKELLKKQGAESPILEGLRKELLKQSTDRDTLKKLLAEYYDGLDEKAKKTIRSYSWKAALCVVFSRNPLVDAVLMFLAQYRMALELMMQYGFKPSPVFNILCFFWIATNSVLNGIFSQATADNVGEIMKEYLLGDGGPTIVLSKLGSAAVEAMTAATTVYVTGWIVNRKLKGERSSVSVKELFAMRKTARKELLCDLTDDARKKIEKWYKESPDEPDTSESA